jgi:L-lactate dehydrogenase complex protein LldE
MADDKLASLAEAGADGVVGCDTSCLLHLSGRAEHEGRALRTRHLVEVLAAALPGSTDEGAGAGPGRDDDR